jgi:hypothetical protein
MQLAGIRVRTIASGVASLKINAIAPGRTQKITIVANRHGFHRLSLMHAMKVRLSRIMKIVFP